MRAIMPRRGKRVRCDTENRSHDRQTVRCPRTAGTAASSRTICAITACCCRCSSIMLFFQVMTGGTLLQPLNLTNLVLQNSYIVIMALGMLLVIVAGHIDLSVGSVVGFVGAVAAVLMVTYKVDYIARLIACLLLGAAIGAAQGYWVAYFKIPSFIVTLGRHAGVQRPRARGVAGPVARTVPGDLPEAVAPASFRSCCGEAGTLHPTSMLIGAVLALGLVYAERQGPLARAVAQASRSSPTRSSSARASSRLRRALFHAI